MRQPHKPGDEVYVNGKRVVIVRQVLFNQPAYRVCSLKNHTRSKPNEWVVDGTYISLDPKHRVGLVRWRTNAHGRSTSRTSAIVRSQRRRK